MIKIITGIGSRQTPQNICDEMKKIGEWCKANNIIVRSGHAEGADWAFEQGAQDSCIAFVPWPNYNANLISGAKISLYHRTKEVIETARKYHPVYDRLGFGAKKLIERNVLQVLGEDLKSKSDIVVCWTSNGALVGGTATALRIAAGENIPVLNMFCEEYNTSEKVVGFLKKA